MRMVESLRLGIGAAPSPRVRVRCAENGRSTKAGAMMEGTPAAVTDRRATRELPGTRGMRPIAAGSHRPPPVAC